MKTLTITITDDVYDVTLSKRLSMDQVRSCKYDLVHGTVEIMDSTLNDQINKLKNGSDIHQKNLHESV